ncbi:hypothetical protein [Roseovarius sp. D22-M7]|uniref:hypothetical protein n=1 Tax=Roseovarius sp. D22-M7 TaxID=3127116 RepID=UPI0030102C43
MVDQFGPSGRHDRQYRDHDQELVLLKQKLYQRETFFRIAAVLAAMLSRLFLQEAPIFNAIGTRRAGMPEIPAPRMPRANPPGNLATAMVPKITY